MKQLSLYQVDAFATDFFTGNPAAVCPLDTWLSDKQMQYIAEENNLSETAFIVPEDRHYRIRWFTPNTEVDLCGHATLASAFAKDQRILVELASGAALSLVYANYPITQDYQSIFVIVCGGINTSHCNLEENV